MHPNFFGRNWRGHAWYLFWFVNAALILLLQAAAILKFTAVSNDDFTKVYTEEENIKKFGQAKVYNDWINLVQ